jgi:LDH2 family malate/lactate/ureidoglycolate dehydrogenase
MPGNGDGYVVIAFRPDLLTPHAELRRELARLIARAKAVPCQPGVAEIRIPGEHSARDAGTSPAKASRSTGWCSIGLPR